MKKLLLVLLCLPMIGFGQIVNIPDANFKAYLVGNALINTNGDTEIQKSEATAFSDSISVGSWSISDLTGIEDFTFLTSLSCDGNQLTSIDVSQNTALTQLRCSYNQLTSLDVSNNLYLTQLRCSSNQLTSLDVSTNTALTYLDCDNNQLLTSLDVRNTNNTNFIYLNTTFNPYLTCIDVDDPTWSTNNWTNIDSWTSFSLNCNPNSGCTDIIACNYDPQAIIDDLSCIYLDSSIIDLTQGLWVMEEDVNCDSISDFVWYSDYLSDGTINFSDNLSNILLGIADPFTLTFYWSLCNGIIYKDRSANSNSIYSGILTNDTISGVRMNSNISGSFDTIFTSGSCASSFILYSFQPATGCTDSTAVNYYNAITDDGSCLYSGCTGPTANNYDPSANLDDGSCDYPCTTTYSSESFEISTGTWVQDTINTYHWSMDSAGTPSNNTGPSVAFDGLNYMFTEASGNYGATTSLINSCVDISAFTDPALVMAYHMYGADMGTLSIDVSDDNGNTWTTEWTISGNQGNVWTETVVSLSAYSGQISVRISGTTGASYTSDIAIDLVRIMEDPIYGCTDSTSCNYYSTATLDDGSCILPDGCTDSLACNYNPTATCDDGTCLTVYGCMDATACNYDTAATCDDGSCILPDGCTDNLACNYNPTATCDDGTCLTVYGCMDATACNYNPTATCDDGSCIGLLGCTDSLAANYNPGATCDNGTCVMICDLSYSIISSSPSTSSSCDGWIYSMIQTSYLPVTYLWNTGSTQPYIISLCYGLYTLTVTDAVGCYIDTAINIGNVILGCTDSTALNYDPLANNDDGSCIYCVYGCTDPVATNYYAGATCDDASCTYVPSTCTSPSPTGAYVNELIHDRARFNWDNMNDANCMVTQYRIKYRELGTNTWLSKTMANSGLCLFGLNTTSKKVVGLTPSTTYEYYMKAWYCGGTTSAWSAIQNFTTTDECQNVINFAVSTPTPTKASFTWDSTAAYSFARIKLRVDTTGGVWTSAGGFGVFYPALSKDKNGLTPGTSYRAQARTWCDPTGGAYRSAAWSPLVFWTQPTSIRLEGGSAINNLAIYPNPSRDVFNICFTSDTKQDLKVRIMNVIGEELINENLEQFIGEYTKQINLSDNAKGVYFLEITNNNGVVNKKLILQ